MRTIAQGFFERSPYMAGPLFTLMLFFCVFVAIIVVLFRAKKDQFTTAAALPFDGETTTEKSEARHG